MTTTSDFRREFLSDIFAGDKRQSQRTSNGQPQDVPVDDSKAGSTNKAIDITTSDLPTITGTVITGKSPEELLQEQITALQRHATYAFKNRRDLNGVSIIDIYAHKWFDKKQTDLAHKAVRGALAAIESDNTSLIYLTLTALAHRYHEDRALHGYHLIRTQKPILREDIPSVPAGEPEYEGYRFKRSIDALDNWTVDIPSSVLDEIVILLEQEIPDQLSLVTYKERDSTPSPDPIIYAQYGPWYVKVAEWD